MNETLMDWIYEIGLENGRGIIAQLRTPPDELENLLNDSSLYDVVAHSFSQDSIDHARVHEVLHCFDVGLGTAQLTLHVMNDTTARNQLKMPQLTEAYANIAFLSGLFHDMILAFHGNAVETETPMSSIEQLITPEAASKFSRDVQYIKDSIGDDLRGAVLLKRCDSQFFPEEVITPSVNALLLASGLPLREAPKNPFGNYVLHKVLDAVWYHDGNYPIRGHAEGDAIVGDRIRLFREGLVGIDVVEAGIKKLLSYTEADPKWEERCTTPDKDYLQRMIAKKAGGDFVAAVSGTSTEQFLYDLAPQCRGSRTINSPAFWAGVDKTKEMFAYADAIPELYSLRKQLDVLHQRHDAIQQYRPGDLK